ncbi:hypothetical protein ACO0QE_003585 [Hanseniaspora vineae]
MKTQEGETQMTLPPTISRLLDNNENCSRNSFFSDVDLEERTGEYDNYLKMGFGEKPDLKNIPSNEKNLDSKTAHSGDFSLRQALSGGKNYLGRREDFPGQFDVDALSLDDEDDNEMDVDAFYDGRNRAVKEDKYGFQDVYMEKLPLKKSNKQAYNFANNFVEAARTSQDTLLLSPVPRVASPLRNQQFLNESSNFELPTRSYPTSASKNVHFMEHNFAENDYDLGSRPVSALSIESSLFASPQQQHHGDYSFNYKLNQSVLDMKNNNNVGEKLVNNSINSTSNNYNTSTSHRGTRGYGSSEQNDLSPVGSRSGRHRKPHIEDLISNAQNLSVYLDHSLDSTTSTTNESTRNSTRGVGLDANSERCTSACSGLGNFADIGHSGMRSFCMEPSTSSLAANQQRNPDSSSYHHNHNHHRSQQQPQKKDQKSFGESSEISSFALSPASNSDGHARIGDCKTATISTSSLSAVVSPDATASHNTTTSTNPHKIDDFLISYPLNKNLSLQNSEESGNASSKTNGEKDEDLNLEETSFSTKPWNTAEFDTTMMSNYKTQDAIELFINTLGYLLTLTNSEDQTKTVLKQSSSMNETFDSFLMKGPASLSYEKFVKNRIQTRCKYSSMIYLNSAYLLLNLLTNYSCHSLPPGNSEGNADAENEHPAKLQMEFVLSSSMSSIATATTIQVPPSTPTPTPSPLSVSGPSPALGNDFNWLLINDMKLIEMVNLIN